MSVLLSWSVCAAASLPPLDLLPPPPPPSLSDVARERSRSNNSIAKADNLGYSLLKRGITARRVS